MLTIPEITDQVKERFFRYVSKSDGCWEWIGTKAGRKPSYGIFRIGSHRRFYAHRISWTIHHSEIPESLFVLHKCDHPICVNPNHLFFGTQSDNMRDMHEKGRFVSGPRLHPERMRRGDNHGSRLHPEKVARGELHSNAKLALDNVREIRLRYSWRDCTFANLAQEFGVAESTIFRIVNGTRWKESFTPKA